MKIIVLTAAAPLLALTACGLPASSDANSSAAANSLSPGGIPDTVEVNGVTYVRAGADKTAPAVASTPSSPPSNLPPPISDSGSSVPPNTGSGGTAADHGE